MAKVKYKMLEHTADIKFKIFGDNLNEIFENSALAFSEVIGRGKKINFLKKKKIKLKEGNIDALLYKFLDELIYLLDAENFVVSKAKVKLKDLKLVGEIYGDSASKYEGLDHVKAATYSEMYVKKKKDGFEGQFVLDV